MSAATIVRLAAVQARQRLPDFADLYRDAYTKPPYDETEEHVTAFLDRFTTELDAPGFSLFAAMIDDRLGGFAHGLTFPPGRWWSDAGTPPDEISGQPTFAVIELIVASRLRRCGIGRSLMTALLANRPEPFATLCANHDVPARMIYHRWGWRQVARAGQTPVGPADVLLLDLRRCAGSLDGSHDQPS